jgi:hypothetical protein
MTAPVLRPLSLGEVLDTGFGLYRALFVPLVIITVVCRVLPTLLGIYVTTGGGFLQHPVAGLVQLVLAFATTAFGVAAVTYVVSGHYLGQDITANTALRQAATRIIPLSILGLFQAVVVGVGFLLLIIPGIILGAGLSLSTVALVIERLPPTAAMDRSWKLTRGFRGKVLLTIFVAGLLFIIPAMILAVIVGIGAALGRITPVAVQVVTAVLQVFVFPYVYAVITVLYYDLRVRKEGFDLDLLAAATAAG